MDAYKLVKFADGTIGETQSTPGVMEVQVFGGEIEGIFEIEESDFRAIRAARASGDSSKLAQAVAAAEHRGHKPDEPKRHRNQ